MSTQLIHQTHDTRTHNTSATAGESESGQSQSDRWRAAFERLEAEIRALPESELVSINLDIPTAATTVGGALNEILPLREQIAKLEGVDITKLDKLRDYTDALFHAQGAYRAAIAPTDPVTQLAADVTAARDQLFTDAHALARRGLIDIGRVEKLRTPSGHRNIAMDVVGLASIFREHAAVLANRTPVTEDELKSALFLAEQLIDAVGDREQAPGLVAAATLVRQQSFTLFVNAYDEVRRAIGFLRWHQGDAESIAPSLWAGRTGKRPDNTDTPNTSTPSAPSPSAPVVAAPAPAASDIPVGLPGSNPFIK